MLQRSPSFFHTFWLRIEHLSCTYPSGRPLMAHRRQLSNQVKDFLKTPVGEWYDGKITRHDHFNDLKDIDDALNSVPEDLTIEDRRRYTEMQFSAGIVHRLLMRELHHDGPEDEMRFMLGHHSVWFSKVEFCLITGLKFGVIHDTTTYQTVQNGIHEQYFEVREEVKYEHLRAVLRCGIFDQQYDVAKLCLLYMLNWILMGVDEREKVPVWQFRLVEDLDAFDVFPWGAYVYRQSIYGFKHALDGRREQFKRRQQTKGADVHTKETYNIYGLAHSLLIYAIEVILELRTKFGTRREVDLSPRILKWRLINRPRPDRLAKIFKARMFTTTALVPTEAERAERYYEGINEGNSLYTGKQGRVCIAVPDTEGSELEADNGTPVTSDSEGSEPEAQGGIPARHRRVRFETPADRTRGDSRGGIREHVQERKLGEVIDVIRDLYEDLRKSNEDHDRKHNKLVDMIRALQGSTSQFQTQDRDRPPDGDGLQDRDGPPLGDGLADEDGPLVWDGPPSDYRELSHHGGTDPETGHDK
ncbi:hypothetical protein Dsin_001558 [Dipteronia sinensis]|uniref:DUF1985 domain-containing protein n=1 Tax=Dipteronia sinensis TaxID=43782 RepID=A0AAE0B5D8_9ROSI|nr:hypothetical protein Dsin_001558 [Dipteronia sinensis]